VFYDVIVCKIYVFADSQRSRLLFPVVDYVPTVLTQLLAAFLFTDDIDLHMSNSCVNVLQTTVNLELCKIDNWLRANKLSLNYNKTNFILRNSQRNNPASFKVIINNHSISPEDQLKYLGVLLDNKLSWKPHVQKVKTQLSRACGVLTKLEHYTTQSVLKVVYNSLIHPYLNYSILNWGRASNAIIPPLRNHSTSLNLEFS